MIIDKLSIETNHVTGLVEVKIEPCSVTRETPKQVKVISGRTMHTINKSELPKAMYKNSYLYERGTLDVVLAILLPKYAQYKQDLKLELDYTNQIIDQLNELNNSL